MGFRCRHRRILIVIIVFLCCMLPFTLHTLNSCLNRCENFRHLLIIFFSLYLFPLWFFACAKNSHRVCKIEIRRPSLNQTLFLSFILMQRNFFFSPKIFMFRPIFFSLCVSKINNMPTHTCIWIENLILFIYRTLSHTRKSVVIAQHWMRIFSRVTCSHRINGKKILWK